MANRVHARPASTRNRGFSLLEAMMAIFTLLICTLIFAGTIPIANKSRGKAQYANIALSLAKKQMETLKHLGYSNADKNQLLAAGLIDTTVPVDMNAALMYSVPGTMGFEATKSDQGNVDSAKDLLPYGRSFVRITDISLDMREIEVVVFWAEGNNTRFVKLATQMANL